MSLPPSRTSREAMWLELSAQRERTRRWVQEVRGQPHSLIGHNGLFMKKEQHYEVLATTSPKASLTKTVHSLPLLFFALSLRTQQVIHGPYLLGSIGVPQPAHKKFWAATTSSLLSAENEHSYSSEIANGAFFTNWKRNRLHGAFLGSGVLILSIFIWEKTRIL